MNKQQLQTFVGNENLTLSEAMQKIDKNASGIMFIADNSNKLTACITDGDIRRFLLAGGKLDAPVMKAANHNPKFAYSEEEAQSLYHKKNWIVIPVLDIERHIVDLYTGEVAVDKSRASLNVPVVINAGGRGTRLDPFTRVLPKPLIPVGDLPIIEHIMQEFHSYSCEQFHIIVNYKKELMKAYFVESENKYNISWYDEEKPLGTGGGLSLLRGKLNETFFFTNCDNLLQANYERMMQFHKENGNVVTMVCAYKNFSIPYGVIEMGANGIIESMKEKPLVSFLTNTGIYIVEPELIDDIEDNIAISFPDIVEKQRQKGRKVAVFPVSESEWMDMGQLDELEKMRKRLYRE